MPQPESQEMNEQDLQEAFRQGRPEALGLIYDKYAPVLLGLATRMMQDPEAAEMVLQHTFVVIWQRRTEFDTSCLSLLSWLILITRDTALATLKSKNQGNNRQTKAALLKEENKPENLNNGLSELKVKNFFCNLAPYEKAALDLVYLQGYTCTEAAVKLGIAEDTLKSWLKTAGRHLREGIGK